MPLVHNLDIKRVTCELTVHILTYVCLITCETSLPFLPIDLRNEWSKKGACGFF